MRFWDSSAIVPLLCLEDTTPLIQSFYKEDRDVLVWILTRIEALSALCRLRREGVLSTTEFGEAKKRLKELAADWTEIQDWSRTRDRADRLLEVHPLTAADALQLGAALIFVEERTADFGFVSLNAMLAEAALKEGFHVLGSSTPGQALGDG